MIMKFVHATLFVWFSLKVIFKVYAHTRLAQGHNDLFLHRRLELQSKRELGDSNCNVDGKPNCWGGLGVGLEDPSQNGRLIANVTGMNCTFQVPELSQSVCSFLSRFLFITLIIIRVFHL